MSLIEGMRARGLRVPHVDPNDGGINARLLVLLESPVPQAVVSDFISRDSPDPSARNMGVALNQAGLARQDVLPWNVVPYCVSTEEKNRNATAADIRSAVAETQAWINALPSLQVVIFCGHKAQQASRRLQLPSGVKMFATFTPRQWPSTVRPIGSTSCKHSARQPPSFIPERTLGRGPEQPAHALIWISFKAEGWMSKHETPMTEGFWVFLNQGTYIPEYPLVERAQDRSPRWADAVILPDEPCRKARSSDYPRLRGLNVTVVQTKIGRMGMSLMGQALFSARLASEAGAARVRSILLCHETDAALLRLLTPFPEVEVWVSDRGNPRICRRACPDAPGAAC
ncbi:uracil-DNA glycosylase [Microvirga yunnanensis]|uniref:uracil-DNA glycosylase n=1 Tax=Microvirga yunnanensis TaxID=2953740 RepID=UPI0021C784A1|nr:uracil-DNA glycosylase [Microvirga sp. HBU65207]